MIIPIHTNYRRMAIEVSLMAPYPMEVVIRLTDVEHHSSDYFRRKLTFKKKDIAEGKAQRKIVINLPISPRNAVLEIFSLGGNKDGVQVNGIKEIAFPPAEVWAQRELHRFIDFAQDFSKKAGYVKTGFYDSKDQEFLIQYMPEIRDQFGKTLVTPARTNRGTGRIQASKRMFKGYTIPVRFFILMHERQHFQIPTRQEKPADLAALQLYLDLGYPKIEAIYACTKVFKSHPESVGKFHVDRAKDIIDFINNHGIQQQNNLKAA